MGAWRDFLAAQGNGSPNAAPSPLEALKARPIRTLIAAFGIVGTITFLLAAAGGPGSDSLRSVVRGGTGRYGGDISTDASAAVTRLPGWRHTAGDGQQIYRGDARWDSVGGGGVLGGEALEPDWVLDPKTGLKYPPDVNPLKMNAYRRANATFVSLVRNSEKWSIMSSMRGVEDRFNRKFGYPWVFLNDEPFTEDFKAAVLSMTRSKVYFGQIPREHWSYPKWVDLDKAAKERKKMEDEKVIYGGSESYRMMCRFNSGFFYRHELMQQFNYYWRVEPGVEYYCDIDRDLFLFMEENKKVYGFTIAIYEYRRTIETLWETVREFVKLHPDYVSRQNSLGFLVDDLGKGMGAEYNLCHFWSNFEIADLRFWRSQAYSDFFEYLDNKGGFFYERWGDAPVHSIAAALFLPSSAIHQFDEVAYRHVPYTHCPVSNKLYHDNGKCFCDPGQSFDLDGYSCMRQWWRVGPNPNDRNP